MKLFSVSRCVILCSNRSSWCWWVDRDWWTPCTFIFSLIFLFACLINFFCLSLILRWWSSSGCNLFSLEPLHLLFWLDLYSSNSASTSVLTLKSFSPEPWPVQEVRNEHTGSCSLNGWRQNRHQVLATSCWLRLPNYFYRNRLQAFRTSWWWLIAPCDTMSSH